MSVCKFVHASGSVVEHLSMHVKVCEPVNVCACVWCVSMSVCMRICECVKVVCALGHVVSSFEVPGLYHEVPRLGVPSVSSHKRLGDGVVLLCLV